MRVDLEIDPRNLVDAIATDCDHEAIEQLILGLDAAMKDYNFTLQLVRKLVKSLRESDDPEDPLKPGDLF